MWRITRSRDKWHIATLLLRDVLQSQGVDISWLFDLSKDELAHLLYAYGRSKTMNYDLKRPCPNCPFRTDLAFYLREGHAQDIAVGLLEDGGTFTCHATVDYDAWEDAKDLDYERGGEGSVPYPYDGTEQHCAGALIMLKKGGKLWHQNLYRIMATLKLFDPDALDMSAPVYESLEAFLGAAKGSV